jgi:hypothetical protein
MVDNMHTAILGERIRKRHPLETIDLQRRIRSEPRNIDCQLPSVQESRQIKMREALYAERLDFAVGCVEDVGV